MVRMTLGLVTQKAPRALRTQWEGNTWIQLSKVAYMADKQSDATNHSSTKESNGQVHKYCIGPFKFQRSFRSLRNETGITTMTYLIYYSILKRSQFALSWNLILPDSPNTTSFEQGSLRKPGNGPIHGAAHITHLTYQSILQRFKFEPSWDLILSDRALTQRPNLERTLCRKRAYADVNIHNLEDLTVL